VPQSVLPNDPKVLAMRGFNRFYTQQIGVLDEGHLKSDYSLAEVRVLYELVNREQPLAGEIARDLGLDPGYLSRMLRAFEKAGLIKRRPSPQDARQSLVKVTNKGQKVFSELDTRASEQIASLLSGIDASSREQLLAAMKTMQRVLQRVPVGKVPYILRSPHPGDLGWIVHRHGALYSQEYGYNERFEALVAKIVAEFVEKYDAKRERCWIAEREGEIVGSVFLVAGPSPGDAKLRLLLVEPKARGLGIGARLVEECVRFARQVGYRKILLWTQSELTAARNIYMKAGFKLIEEDAHQTFGKHLVAETWALSLKQG
jgi:DNA-binding MarR family transcriptional regulator/GNAT superfamily N-acetyltransferase